MAVFAIVLGSSVPHYLCGIIGVTELAKINNKLGGGGCDFLGEALPERGPLFFTQV